MDGVLLRHACPTAGIHHLALTKLDVLDGLPRIRIGAAYLVDGEPVRAFPSRMSEQARVQPVYEEMDGWAKPVSGARVFNDLPSEAVRFVRRLEELVEVPISILSTGPDRAETMLVPAT
jgi:adenylosuccinate synthase